MDEFHLEEMILRIIRRFWWVVPVVLVLVGAGFVIWASSAAQPMPEALAALQSTDSVTVEADDWLVFAPVGDAPQTGFVFYPGGRVDARAYAPYAQAIASEGYLVVIVPMPLNLAVLDPGAAGDVLAEYPEIETWAIGGHSLGGAMAANYVYANEGQIKGLALWASFPAGNNDLSAQVDLEVVSVFGTLDGLATVEEVEASLSLLPSTTVLVEVDGGNHAQFGWYGSQSGDNVATLSHEAQQEQTVATMLTMLAGLSTD